MVRCVPLAELIGSIGAANPRPSAAIENSESSTKEQPAVSAEKQALFGLTGNAIPQCPAGKYVASLICKKSAPEYYLDFDMKYPAPFPSRPRLPRGANQSLIVIRHSMATD